MSSNSPETAPETIANRTRLGLERYLAFFESLTPSTLSEFHHVAAADIHFEDPFNSVDGVDAAMRIFEDMFKRLNAPGFTIVGCGVDDRDQSQAYAHWHFSARTANADRPIAFSGISKLAFNADGRCTAHIDYWNPVPPIYGKIPLLGPIIRFIEKKVSAH